MDILALYHLKAWLDSQAMISKWWWRKNMEWSTWSQLLTCQNAQLTPCHWQSRMDNGHGTMSMLIVTNMPECTTHLLWLVKQDEEWTWDHQHGHSHQHARMHNSPPMSAKGSTIRTHLLVRHTKFNLKHSYLKMWKPQWKSLEVYFMHIIYGKWRHMSPLYPRYHPAVQLKC